MSKRKKKKRKKKFQGSPYTPYTIEATTDERLIQPGLLPLVEVLAALKIKQQVDALFTAPVSNLGHSNSNIVNTFVLMLNKGGEGLEDICILDFERESLKLAGIKQIPKADTLAKWLRHHGEAGVPLIHQLNRTVIAETLKSLKVKRPTLDINTTVILAKRPYEEWRTLEYCDLMPIIGTIAESGQVIAVESQDKDAPPNYDSAAFIKACQAQLPDGVELGRVRSDRIGYQKELIEDLAHQNIEFIIHARIDTAIREVIATVPPADWKPLRLKDDSLSQQKWVARRSHTMQHSDTEFDIVIQRSLKSEVADLPNQEELPGLSVPAQSEIKQYVYRAIATNIKGLDDEQILHEYNQRGPDLKNRIRELKYDFAAGYLPCNDFGPDSLYVCICALAYNVFALMRARLPAKFRFARASTVRDRLFRLPPAMIQNW